MTKLLGEEVVVFQPSLEGDWHFHTKMEKHSAFRVMRLDSAQKYLHNECILMKSMFISQCQIVQVCVFSFLDDFAEFSSADISFLGTSRKK